MGDIMREGGREGGRGERMGDIMREEG